MKYGPDWEPPQIDWTSTRGRILRESSVLFAQHGYFGTSTRDIAEAVNIRQPSLFHHFGAKHQIFRALVELDLGPSVTRVREHLDEVSSWADKLHLTVARDVQAGLLQPFDARGLYDDAVLVDAEFDAERDGIAEYHRLIERVLTRGQKAGEFVAFDPSFVQRAINGVLFETLREQGGPDGRRLVRRPLQAADFVLRGLLTEPERLDAIRDTTLLRLDTSRTAIASRA